MASSVLMVQVDEDQIGHVFCNCARRASRLRGKLINHTQGFPGLSNLRDEEHVINYGDCSSNNHKLLVARFVFPLIRVKIEGDGDCDSPTSRIRKD